MPSLSELTVKDVLPEREHKATEVSLFLYNAAIWNAHRIHYDDRYAREVENHPGLLIDGPLQGDWLSQVVSNWLGDDGQVIRFSYSNRRAAYLGETLTSGGEIVSIDQSRGEVTIDLFVRNEAGEVVSPGSATVRLS